MLKIKSTKAASKDIWDLKQLLEEKIRKNGGWISAHNHLDKAYLIRPMDMDMAYHSLQRKWDLIDDMKERWTVTQIYDRMCFGIEQQLNQGVTALCTFIDVDPKIKDKSIKAAEKVKEKYERDLILKFANQTIKGVLNKEARNWFDIASEFVDIIGGLPGKDRGHEDEHMDILLSTAKKLNKMVHVHVDQLNLPTETETEFLVNKTDQHQMHGRVVAVHGISIGAHPKSYRDQLYKRMKKNGVMVIACPTAWIDHRRSELLVPSHNAVTPVDELIPAGVTVAMGPDNIADYYKPFTDGDMWTELRFLLESCHYYQIEELVKVATINGRKVLGLT